MPINLLCLPPLVPASTAPASAAPASPCACLHCACLRCACLPLCLPPLRLPPSLCACPAAAVVYLDADAIAVRATDELFLCDGLCGVMRHSERINTGVLVASPSAALFEELMAAVASTPSYTGGDQGFINSFFAGG